MQRHQITFLNFDTVNTLSIWGDPELLEKARRFCARCEERFSRFRPGSDIWRINHAEGEPVTVSGQTADLIRRAVEYAARTDGVFDITVGALTSLWDFSGDPVKEPKASQLRKRAGEVGSSRIEIEGRTVRVPAAVRLDLGAIAKGYITDALAEMFRKEGVSSGLINLGGNIFALGTRPDGSPWRVGIQRPQAGACEYSALVEVADSSVVTSGIYERGYCRGEHWRHHVLDVNTGLPVDNALAAVTVICDSSTDADVYSTAALCLGAERSRPLLEKTPGLRAFFQHKDGTTRWLGE